MVARPSCWSLASVCFALPDVPYSPRRRRRRRLCFTQMRPPTLGYCLVSFRTKTESHPLARLIPPYHHSSARPLRRPPLPPCNLQLAFFFNNSHFFPFFSLPRYNVGNSRLSLSLSRGVFHTNKTLEDSIKKGCFDVKAYMASF